MFQFLGLITILIPFATNYTQLVIFILLIGPFCGSAVVLFYCLVGDSLGMRRAPLAYGIVGATNGGFYFTKPFFLGYFRDIVRSYNGMFYSTGGMTVFTGELVPPSYKNCVLSFLKIHGKSQMLNCSNKYAGKEMIFPNRNI